MMITYIKDDKKIYDDELLQHLRSYNQHFTGITEFGQSYIYIIDAHQLKGALTISCFWDWATIGDVYYTDLDVLKCLIQKAFALYKDKIVGVKFFSPVKERFDDFIEVGFKHTKTLKNMGYSRDFYYADLYALNEKTQCAYEIIIQSEAHKTYHLLASAEFKSFDLKHKLTDQVDDLLIIALDGDQFVGGVSCDVYADTIYISRIVVKKMYRGLDIGTHLMQKVEEEANKRCIHLLQLGTCEFQAKEFYQKLGYEVVYIRENNPKGYQAYSMIKRL